MKSELRERAEAAVQAMDAAGPQEDGRMWSTEQYGRLRDTAIEACIAYVRSLPAPGEAVPIPMILFCPQCHLQHVDEPDDRTPDWKNPPHRSHLCHGCGCIWRPADVATVGVKAITTKGKADNFDYATAPPQVVEGFYLASFKRPSDCVTWWAPNNSGYTYDLDRAGVYTVIELGYHDCEYTVPVPVRLVWKLKVRRTIDPGDTLNNAFRNAESLRAWIAALAARGG